jgi:hypothetical protein
MMLALSRTATMFCLDVGYSSSGVRYFVILFVWGWRMPVVRWNFHVSRALGAKKKRSSRGRVIVRRHFDKEARKPCSVWSHHMFFWTLKTRCTMIHRGTQFSFLKSVWSSTPQVCEPFLSIFRFFCVKWLFKSRVPPSKTRLLSVESQMLLTSPLKSIVWISVTVIAPTIGTYFSVLRVL